MNMRCVGRRFLFYALHPHPAGNSYSIVAMRIFYFFPHARRHARAAGNNFSMSLGRLFPRSGNVRPR